MIEFTRDDQALAELEQALSNPDAILVDISVGLAEETLNLVKEGFDAQADPYGKGWANTKSDKQGAGHAILVESTSLKNSWNRQSVDADGFNVASAGVEYASYHQSGTSRVVSRQMVPDEGDIPPAWEKRFDETAEEFLDEIFGD